MATTKHQPGATPSKFLGTAGMTALLVLGAVAAFNAAVDPLGMSRAIEIDGLNAHKPAVYTRVRIAKAYEVRRVKPGAVILGTSRTHLGLRPSHEGWSPGAGPGYNLAFDGATTREMYLYLRHAHSVSRLRQVVLGLDTWQLTETAAPTRPGFDPTVLYDSPTAVSRLAVALADARLLISLDTLRLSLQTLQAQADAEPEWFAADGQRLGEVFFRRRGEVFHDSSPRDYFESYDRDEVSWQMEGKAPGARRPAPPSPPADAQETSLDYVRHIVEFCRSQSIDLRIYVTPTHARNMEIAAAAGNWEGIETGKRKLAALIAGDAARHPGARPVPAYDFADYSSVTTEPLPPRGGKAEMRNYWDSSHFKEQVGDLVLDRLFGVTASGRHLPADFGVRLDESNIEQHLENVRQRQLAYRKANPEDVTSIAAMVARERASGS